MQRRLLFYWLALHVMKKTALLQPSCTFSFVTLHPYNAQARFKHSTFCSYNHHAAVHHSDAPPPLWAGVHCHRAVRRRRKRERCAHPSPFGRAGRLPRAPDAPLHSGGAHGAMPLPPRRRSHALFTGHAVFGAPSCRRYEPCGHAVARRRAAVAEGGCGGVAKGAARHLSLGAVFFIVAEASRLRSHRVLLRTYAFFRKEN